MLNLLTARTLHEFYAARPHAAAATGGMALGVLAELVRDKNTLWIRQLMIDTEVGTAYLRGISEYGLDAERLILLRARHDMAALQAALEGARTPGLGAVLVEIWGEARAYDLTASRRLALAAKASGVTLLMLRVAALPQPSAAETRWLVRPSPSRPLAARAPGPPVFEASLLRSRNGQEGVSYRLEWNRDERRFAILDHRTDHEREARQHRPGEPPLSGLVATFPVDRSALPQFRQAG